MLWHLGFLAALLKACSVGDIWCKTLNEGVSDVVLGIIGSENYKAVEDESG